MTPLRGTSVQISDLKANSSAYLAKLSHDLEKDILQSIPEIHYMVTNYAAEQRILRLKRCNTDVFFSFLCALPPRTNLARAYNIKS